MHVTLRLLLNLSFDGELCTRMVELGLMPHLVSCLSIPEIDQVCVVGKQTNNRSLNHILFLIDIKFAT